MVSDETDISTSSIPYQPLYKCRQHSISKLYIQESYNTTKDTGVYATQAKMSMSLLHPCSRCGQRGHRMHQTSRNQCRLTLSMVFTLNPQDLSRYSTMDNWPSWAAQCKAVYPLSSESKRWPSILGARYSATTKWPPSAHNRKALLPPCKLGTGHNRSPLVHTCMKKENEILGMVGTCSELDIKSVLCYRMHVDWVAWDTTKYQK